MCCQIYLISIAVSIIPSISSIDITTDTSADITTTDYPDLDRIEFFNDSEPYQLLAKDDDLQNLASMTSSFAFDGTTLVVRDTVDFILVRPANFSLPFLEICGIDPNCQDT